jgi:hypothetical protein
MSNEATMIENAGDLAMSILYGLQALTCVFLWTQLRRRREQKRIRAFFFLMCFLAGVTRCLWFGLPDSVFAQGYEPENRRPQHFGSQAFLLNVLQYIIYAIPNLLYFCNYCLLICTWSSMIHLMFSSLRPGSSAGVAYSASSHHHGSRSSAGTKTTGIMVQPMSSNDHRQSASVVRESRLIAWRTARRFFRFTTIVVCVLQLALIGSMFVFDFFDVLCATCIFVSAMALFSLIGYSAYALVTVQKLRPMYVHYFAAQAMKQQQAAGEGRNVNSDADALSSAGLPGSSSGSQSQSSPSASFTHVRASHRSQIDTEESYETHQIERNRGGFRGGHVGAESITSPTAGVASNTTPLVSKAGTQQSYSTTNSSKSGSGSSSGASKVSSSSSSTHRTHHLSRVSQQHVRSSTSDDLSYEPTYGEEDDDEEEDESTDASGSDEEITAAAAKHLANALNGQNEVSRPPSQPSPPPAAGSIVTLNVMHEEATLPAARASASSPYTPSSSSTNRSASPLGGRGGAEPSLSVSPAYQRFPPPTFPHEAATGDGPSQPPSMIETSDAEDPSSSPRHNGGYMPPSATGPRSSARQSRSGSPLTVIENGSSNRSGRTSVVGNLPSSAVSNPSSSPSPSPRDDPERVIALYAWHRTRQIALLTLCVVLGSAARIISALIELHYTWLSVEQDDAGGDGSTGFPSFWWLIIDSYYLVFELCTSTIAMFILTQASGLSAVGGTRITAAGKSDVGVGINQPSIATIIPTPIRREHQSGAHRANSEDRLAASGSNATTSRSMLIPSNPSITPTTSLGPYSPSMHTVALHSKLLSVSYQPSPKTNKQRFSSQPLLSSSVTTGSSASGAANGGDQLENAQRIENLRQVFGKQ